VCWLEGTRPCAAGRKVIAMAASEVTHRGLDGMRFAYSSEQADLSHPGMSVAKVVVGGTLREFTAGPLEAGAVHADHLGVVLGQEFVAQGGRLRIGQALQRDPSGRGSDRLLKAVWEGQRYSLSTHLYDGGTKEAIALLNAVQISEQDDGITITPRQDAPAWFEEPPKSVKWVPGLGIVVARRLDRKRAQVLPAWGGARVAGGELFRDTLGNGEPYLVLATPSAVVTILPTTGSPLGAVARLAGELRVDALA
jgi:hypothetical protein